MNYKLLSLAAITFATLSFTSCIKDNVNELGDGGSSFLKLTQAPTNSIFFSPFTGVQNATVLTARRDVANNAQSNTPVSFKFEVSSDSVTRYNTVNGTSYAPLPDSLSTLGSGVTRSGNIYTLTLNAGELQKDLIIGINGSKWDLTKTYALAFKVVDSAGLRIASGSRNVIALISIKNAYDGIYSVVSGSVQRYTAPGAPESPSALSGNLVGNPDVSLNTAGPSSVGIPASSSPGTLYWAFGNNSAVAGIDNVRIAVDPATNLVSMSSLGNATLANWETKENRYDPVTKTFFLNFRWNPNSNRREYSIVLKYKGPR